MTERRTQLSDLAAPAAVLLDVDGTLVDSNYLHVQAWWDAFVAVGHPVPAWRVHRAIGRDSHELLDALLGPDAGRLGRAASEEHDRRYSALSDRLLRRVAQEHPGGREHR